MKIDWRSVLPTGLGAIFRSFPSTVKCWAIFKCPAGTCLSGLLSVNLYGRHVPDEALVDFVEARAHLLHLLAVLKVGAATLQDEVGRGGSDLQFEARVREHARLQVCAPEFFQVVADRARRLVDDARPARRGPRNELDGLPQPV